jgi:hypothetical protein
MSSSINTVDMRSFLELQSAQQLETMRQMIVMMQQRVDTSQTALVQKKGKKNNNLTNAVNAVAKRPLNAFMAFRS